MESAVNPSLFVKTRDPMGRFLVGSAAAHAVLAAAVLAFSYLGVAPPIDLNQKPIRASLVRLGKARDPNLLPVKEELPPPPKKEEPVNPAPEPPKDPPKPTAPAAVALPLKKPAPSTKQEGDRSAAERRRDLLSAFNKMSKNTKPREIVGAADGDPYGDSAAAEGERYLGLLSAQVHRHYDISNTIPDQERLHLKAQVHLYIGRTGEVIRSQLVQGSGNGLFDSAVLSAVKKASPFSPPPDHLRASLQKSGVVLEFRP